jgi:hypothetical protein
VIRICYRLWAVLEALRFFLVILGEGSLRRAAKRHPAYAIARARSRRAPFRTDFGWCPSDWRGARSCREDAALLGYYDSTMAEARRMVRGESD